MLSILFQDEVLIAVDKPAGRIVIPGRGDPAERALRDELAEQLGAPVWVVHRLDRGTSGVLLFARDARAHRALSLAFERHQVDKRYWALCRGTLVGSGEVDAALVPVRGGKVRAARPGEAAGKPSRTAWRALARYGNFTAAELRPRTGRLHQVRAHAAALGHPLAVDPDYGGLARLTRADLDPSADPAHAGDVIVDRVTLHAAAIVLKHPVSRARLEIEAPLAADLAAAVELLGGGPGGSPPKRAFDPIGP